MDVRLTFLGENTIEAVDLHCIHVMLDAFARKSVSPVQCYTLHYAMHLK